MPRGQFPRKPGLKRNKATKPLAERFWPKVNKDGPLPEERPELGPCWVWTGFIDKAGYGRIQMGRRTDPVGYAHHVVLDLVGIPVPAGYERDHLCRRRSCCRPDHLEPVIHPVNVARGEAPMVVLGQSGYCLRGHEATNENVYRRESTGAIAYCRPCRRAQRREAYQRKAVHGAGDPAG
jgi:hypothetical protein